MSMADSWSDAHSVFDRSLATDHCLSPRVYKMYEASINFSTGKKSLNVLEQDFILLDWHSPPWDGAAYACALVWDRLILTVI